MPDTDPCKLIDAGVNLASSRFDKDLPEVLQRARQAGVSTIVAIGCDLKSSRRCMAIAADHPGYAIATTAGIHPHNADSADRQALAQLREMVQHPTVVAVGETGLDFNRNFSSPERQRSVFSAQLDIAAECQKPVYLHQRDAFDEQMAILKDYRQTISGGLAHCFTGNLEQARAYLDLGLYIGITGWLCDPRRGQELRDALAYIPLERLILETDAPYLLPRHLEKNQLAIPDKRRNEPVLLAEIAAYLGKIKGCSRRQVAGITSENARMLFQLPTSGA